MKNKFIISTVFIVALFYQIMAQETNNKWIENEKVFEAMKNKSSTFFNELGNWISVSDDYNFSILIRNHNSWFIENQGWRDANEKPTKPENGRLVINFYKLDRNTGNTKWFKAFIPIKYSENCKIESFNNDKYRIRSANGEIIGNYKNFDSLMWDLINGKAEKEFEIENKFKLIGI